MSRKRSLPLWHACALGVAICVGAGRAEGQAARATGRTVGPVVTTPPKVHQVIVRLDGCRNVPDRDVFVIIDDHDEHEIRLNQEGSEWTVDTDPFRFGLKGAHASVRFGNARTDCRPAITDNGRAKFIFTSCDEPVRRVMISTDPGIPFAYVRELNSGQPGSVPCKERAVSKGNYTVNAFQFPVEALRLQLGLNDRPKPDADGLLLFSGNAGAPVFGFSRNAAAPEVLVVDSDWKKVARTIEGGVRLESGDIMNVLVLKNRNRVIAPVSFDVYERMLGKLKTVDVTAVK